MALIAYIYICACTCVYVLAVFSISAVMLLLFIFAIENIYVQSWCFFQAAKYILLIRPDSI